MKKTRVWGFATAVACSLTWVGAHTLHADESAFRVERLRVPGRVTGVQAEDLDGDGKRELVVSFTSGRAAIGGGGGQRQLAVFSAGGKGGFGAAPEVLRAPPGAVFADIADLDGDKRRSILYADQKGVYAWRRGEDGRFDASAKQVVQVRGLLALPDDAELPFVDLARDWDGDGKSEMLVPILDGVAVFARDGGAWARAGTLRIVPAASHMIRTQMYEPRLRNFTARVTYVVPELVSVDWDGDGKLDLCAVYEDVVQVHKGTGNGFATGASMRHLVSAKTAEEVSRASAHVTVMVRDVDSDGVADLVVNKLSGGLGQMRAETVFYYGKKGGGFDPPAQVLKREGYAGAISFADMDGDGRPELVMPHVSVGLAEMARALVSKRMRVDWEVRKNRGRSFSVEADAVKEIDFVVDTSQLADIDGPFPQAGADFNGDGKGDFVAMNAPGQLGIWLGGGAQLLAESPKVILHVQPSKQMLVSDLDGDRRAEIVLFYKGKEASSEVVVAWNTGQGW